MPELGKYATAIFSAWGLSLGALALLIGISWVQSRRARRALDAAEARQNARKEALNGRTS